MLSQKDYNILRLFRSKNVGPLTFVRLLEYFGDCETAISNIQDFNRRSRSKNPIVIASKEEIDREIVGCSTIGAKIITFNSKEYPRLLKHIDTFPPVLTILGNQELLNRRSISIVGSRTASSNGCNFARKLARELGEADFVITSGFASGIDSSAHRGAIETGTIAVLGGGVDDIYPRGNEELYYEIKNKGLIISEVPFNSAPRAENFPARNRIVSGLSEAIIVIEAGARSGTLHTARQALEQGRELLVTPGNPYDYRCEGSNKLIKDGANVVTSLEDVLDIVQNFRIDDNPMPSFALSDVEREKIKNDNLIFDGDLEDTITNDEKAAFEEELKEPDPMDNKELILSKLNHTPISLDLLSQDLGIQIKNINEIITELELEGNVVVENGMARIK